MLLNLVLGAVVGIILALTGAGGGILAVPLLVFGAHMGVAESGPVGLLAVGMAAALGAAFGMKAGITRYRAAVLIAAAGMLVAPAGMWLAQRAGNRWLGILFGIILFYVAFKTYRQATSRPSDEQAPSVARPCVRKARNGRFAWNRPCAGVLALSGGVAGLLSGLLGIGGGFVMVPALRRYTDLEMQSTVATSLAVIALVSAAGIVLSSMAGTMNWRIGLPFSIGALAGMLGGRAIATRLKGVHLQMGFAAVSIVVAIGMIGKALYV